MLDCMDIHSVNIAAQCVRGGVEDSDFSRDGQCIYFFLTLKKMEYTDYDSILMLYGAAKIVGIAVDYSQSNNSP